MKLEFNRNQLLELMHDFYTLSGIRIVLFDDDYHELLSYPEQPCDFCRMMKTYPKTRKLCDSSDANSFRDAEAQKKLILYHCHAGLIEAAIPLTDNHVTIGYLMFGQLSDMTDEKALQALLADVTASYELPVSENLTAGIPLKTAEQIHAAAKIMEACTHYALLRQTIGIKRQRFGRILRTYLLAHLSEPLQAQDIADALNISRSKLYQQCDQYLGMGVGEYLKKLRLEQAQILLRNTHFPITQIAGEVGFSDYTYFCRVFKRECGVSAQGYRKSFSARNDPEASD